MVAPGGERIGRVGPGQLLVPIVGALLLACPDRASALEVPHAGRSVLLAVAAVLAVCLAAAAVFISAMQKMVRLRTAELNRSRVVLKRIIDALPQAVFWKDRECTYVGCNVAFARLAQRGHPKEIVGKTDFDLPWRADDAERFRAEDRAVMEQNRPTRHAETSRGAGGELLWLDVAKIPLVNDRGRVYGVVGLIDDVTERKRAEEALRRSEEQYRRIVETAREGIWVVDAGGRTVLVNEQLARMLGRTVEEMRGAPLEDFLDDDDPGFGTGEAGGRRGAGEQRESRFRRKDGSILWALVETTPFLDEHGAYAGALAMLTDVTERRAMEAQLRQVQKLEAVGRLAGGVAHDFNNILTAILGSARALVKGLPASDPLREEAVEIEETAQKAVLLTRQLLAFGRKQPVEPRPVDVAAVVASAERLLRRLIGEDVELSTAAPPGPARVRVDPVQLEQVILNLAVNARDAMPGGGRLTIEVADDAPRGEGPARCAPDRGRFVRLRVRDTGVGMSPEVQSHLFEPFFTTKATGKGTGLGLATVYGIVKQAGGEIEVRSEVGQGTTFEILLPRLDAEAAPAAASPPRAVTRGTETVLVVEDEPVVRTLMARALRGAGYRVLEAEGADEALRLVAGGAAVDLLLTDVVMPRGGGPALAERLRAERPGLPVLFASGYMERLEQLKARLGPRTGLLPKPFVSAELPGQVRALLDEAGEAVSAADPPAPATAGVEAEVG